MDCNFCGAYIEDGSERCEICGRATEIKKEPVKEEKNESDYIAGESNSVSQAANKPAWMKNEKLPVVIACCAVGVVALVCFIIIAVFAAKNREPQYMPLDESRAETEAAATFVNEDYSELKAGMRTRVVADIPDSDYIDMYYSPSESSGSIVSVPEAEYVDILEDHHKSNSSFVYAMYSKNGKDYEGWVDGRYLYFVSWNDEIPDSTTTKKEETTKSQDSSFENLTEGAVCTVSYDTPSNGGVTIRELATPNSEDIGTAKEGSYVLVYGDYSINNNGYVCCLYFDGYTEFIGWIKAKYLNVYCYVDSISAYYDYTPTPKHETTTTAPTTTQQAGTDDYVNYRRGDVCYIRYDTASSAGLNLRKEPSSSSKLLQGGVAEGTRVLVLQDYSSADKGYLRVFCNGEEGYLMGRYLDYDYYVSDVYDYYDYAQYMQSKTTVATTQATTIDADSVTDFKYFTQGMTVYVGNYTVYGDGLTLRSLGSRESEMVRTQPVEEGTELYVEKDYDSADDGYILVSFVDEYGEFTGYLKGKYLVY